MLSLSDFKIYDKTLRMEAEHFSEAPSGLQEGQGTPQDQHGEAHGHMVVGAKCISSPTSSSPLLLLSSPLLLLFSLTLFLSIHPLFQTSCWS